MPSFGPISSAAIAALPDYLLNTPSIAFTADVIYAAVPYSPYLQLVNGQGRRIAYALELNLRAVR
jgi:hypothetical protein